MKIVHISDIHINAEPILDLDPVENFRKCLAHVEEYQPDADRIVITGDLTHHGLAESYRLLKEMLAGTSLTGDRAPRLLIGNHDRRETFAAAFPDAKRDRDGFIQWSEETPAGVFIYMDTVEPGTHAGAYCEKRRGWLEGELDDARREGKPAFLFMHHNPTTVHVANADQIGIRDETELKALLARYRETVRHIFFGHCHFSLSGTVTGIPFSAPRSTNHPCWPDFSGNPLRMGHGALQPNYNVCFLGADDVIVHAIDFLDADKVRWEETTEEGWIPEGPDTEPRVPTR
ncbi:phosphodiesterase [Oricola sp.]|uniref:phosphodiesterase n=1 Tax=Oricola sp. TaxID=1979950 RepID=UPI003518B2E7|tara:strand:+ start:6721 stop:7584 length:864 start_codon:yes stop_codon:yes gene_type:complete